MINPITGRVKEVSDLIQDVRYYDYATGTYVATPTSGTPQFNRFCSGSLTDPGVLYDERSRSGTRGQLYFGNEESDPDGRTFAVNKRGIARQLPRPGDGSPVAPENVDIDTRVFSGAKPDARTGALLAGEITESVGDISGHSASDQQVRSARTHSAQASLVRDYLD